MKEKDILLNAVMLEQIRVQDNKTFNELEDFALSLISSPGLGKMHYEPVCNLLLKDCQIDSNSDLFYGIFLHIIDPIQLFTTIRQKPNYKDKMIPFLMNVTESSYFLVTEKLAKVINRFKNDDEFKSWIIKYSKIIYMDLKNRDSSNGKVVNRGALK